MLDVALWLGVIKGMEVFSGMGVTWGSGLYVDLENMSFWIERGLGIGCPPKLVLYRNNRNWNQN